MDDSEIKIQEMKDNRRNEISSLMLKIVVVGDNAVGKSNVLSRFVNNEFSRESKSTVGVELSTKLYLINDSPVKVHIWDTAGQERYHSITAAYYKGALGAMIVYDTTRKETFNGVDKWYKEIKSLADKNIVILMVGNKCDLKLLRQVEYEDALNKSQQLSIYNLFICIDIPFMETSALDASNIEEAFKKLILQIYLETVKNNFQLGKGNTDSGLGKSTNKIEEGKNIKLTSNKVNNLNTDEGRKCSC